MRKLLAIIVALLLLPIGGTMAMTANDYSSITLNETEKGKKDDKKESSKDNKKDEKKDENKDEPHEPVQIVIYMKAWSIVIR